MAANMNVFVSIGAKLLPSLNTAARGVERRFDQMSTRLKTRAAETKLAMREMQAASSGLLGLAAAGGLIFGVSKAIGSGANMAHELSALRNAGRTVTEVKEAFAAAKMTTSLLPTTTWAQNIELINETTSAFGDLHHAVKNLTFNAKFGSMMANSLKIDQSEANHAIAQAVQALEIRGTAMDPAKYQKEMEGLYKAMVFTKGQFNPGELKAFAQTGNIPLKMFSERFMTKILPSLITEFGGGDTVGTMFTAFQNQIMGKVPLGGKKLTEEWLNLGLINEKDAQGHSNMSRTGWKPGAVVGHQLAMSDPLEWFEKIMLPALAKHGVDTKNDEAVITKMKAMFGRETGARIATTLALVKQRQRLHKDEALIDGALPLDEAYKQTLAGDPTAGWSAIMQSMTNLGASIFGPGADGKPSPVALAMVNIAKGINALAETINANPWLKTGLGMLLLGGAGLASLKLLNIGLTWLLGPLGALARGVTWLIMRFGSLRMAMVVARYGLWGVARTMLGSLFSGLGRLATFVGPMLWRGLATLGPLALRGLVMLGPWLMRGLAMVFGLLSNPVGWAILAATLIYVFRDEIAKGWNMLVSWFTSTAWPAVANTVSAAINWGSMLVDNIKAGIAAKWESLKGWFRDKWNGLAPGALQIGGGAAAPAAGGGAPPPGRALGGSVSAGVGYQWHERGREMFVPGKSGTVIPAHVVAAMNRGAANDRGGAPVNATFNIQSSDPNGVAREVHRVLGRLAAGQSGLFSD